MQPVDEGKDWDLISYCDSDWAGDAETSIKNMIQLSDQDLHEVGNIYSRRDQRKSVF
jgi:hypothetical protein